jgi:hypothetical protein
LFLAITSPPESVDSFSGKRRSGTLLRRRKLPQSNIPAFQPQQIYEMKISIHLTTFLNPLCVRRSSVPARPATDCEAPSFPILTKTILTSKSLPIKVYQ